MKVLAVASRKGGAGKTTTAVNLAAALAEQGQRVILCDLDPQATTTTWTLGPIEPPAELFELLTGRNPATGATADWKARTKLETWTRETPIPGVRLLPGSPYLASADVIAPDGAQLRLRRALERSTLAADWIVIDTPPALGTLLAAALLASQACLAPTAAQALAVSGITGIEPAIEAARDSYGFGAVLWGILPCRVTRTTLAVEVIERLREKYGPLVTTTTIRESVRMAEAPSWHQPITTYAPTSSAAEDYRALAVELNARRWPNP